VDGYISLCVIIVAIMMQSQQHQSLSSTLRLIDERLEAIMSSANQPTTVSDLIQKFLNEIMNPINPQFRWELIMNTMFAGMRYSLTIWEHWGRHKAVTANVNYDSDKLTPSCLPRHPPTPRRRLCQCTVEMNIKAACTTLVCVCLI
jgi:hypothetical protein